MVSRNLLVAALLGSSSLFNTALAADEVPIPAEQFFKNPDMTGAKLSPDGRYVAVRTLSPHGRSMLAIVDIAARQSKPIAGFGNADVGDFFWMNNQRLGFTVINVDHGGEIGKPGLFLIDSNGKNRKPVTEVLVPNRSFAEGSNAGGCCLPNTKLLGFDTTGDHIFAKMVYEDEGTWSLIRLDTRIGIYEKIEAPEGTYSWLADSKGTVRITAARRGKTISIFHGDEKRTWRKIHSYEENTDAGFQPLLYLDGIVYVLANNGKDEAAIYRYDIQKNALGSQPLITAPGFDPDGEFVVDNQKMLGFRFATDAETTVWFNDAMKAAQQEVDQLQPGTVNSISR